MAKKSKKGLGNAIKGMSGITLVCALLISCASGPRDQKYSLSTPASANDGVIFGKICNASALRFKQVGSDTEIIHIGGNTSFAIKLPADKYTISGIGSVRGWFASFNPYEVEVKPNTVAYVGTIIPSWASAEKKFRDSCVSEEAKISVEKKYGLERPAWVRAIRGERNKDEWPVYLAVSLEEAMAELKTNHPDFAVLNVEINLLH